MMRLYGIFSTLVVFLLTSCVQSGKEKEIEERERAVSLREQQVAAMESDYQALLKMRDSVEVSRQAVLDTTIVERNWPETLQGEWNSKMVCRSSGCGTYVIGDQRNEVWRFQMDSTGVYVEVINNEQQLRRFTGTYDGQKVILILVTDSTISTRYSRRVVLDHITAKAVKGSQYLIDHNNCETVFSVELTPREK